MLLDPIFMPSKYLHASFVVVEAGGVTCSFSDAEAAAASSALGTLLPLHTLLG